VKHFSLRSLILFGAIFFMMEASFSVLVLSPLAQAQNLPKDSRSTPGASMNTPAAAPTTDVFEEYRNAVQASSEALTKYGEAVKASSAAILASNNALKPAPPESVRDYGWKRAEDFLWSLTTWIFLVVLIVAISNWARIKVEVERLARSLQTVRLGPVELAVRGIDKIKADFSGWNLPLPGDVKTKYVELTSLYSMGTYPRVKIAKTLDDPFFALDWPIITPRLSILEALVAVQEERLRSSPDFIDDKPQRELEDARGTLFDILITLGNLHGFALLPDWTNQRRSGFEVESRFVNLETARFFLEKAIELRPKLPKPQTTIGYASFCLGAIKGLIGMQDGVAEADRRRLINFALQDLHEAEENKHAPAYQYHLKAALLMTIGKVQEASEAWRQAAESWSPPSAKMFFNCACALSKLAKYKEALDELERAITIHDEKVEADKRKVQAAAGVPDFDPRGQALDAIEGEEFKPFRDGDTVAVAAKSASGRTFSQIVG
jgi:tetratricopeptide (TPR) repeat protein